MVLVAVQLRTYPAWRPITQSFGERGRQYLWEAGFNQAEAVEVNAVLSCVVAMLFRLQVDFWPALLMQALSKVRSRTWTTGFVLVRVGRSPLAGDGILPGARGQAVADHFRGDHRLPADWTLPSANHTNNGVPRSPCWGPFQTRLSGEGRTRSQPPWRPPGRDMLRIECGWDLHTATRPGGTRSLRIKFLTCWVDVPSPPIRSSSPATNKGRLRAWVPLGSFLTQTVPKYRIFHPIRPKVIGECYDTF